MGPSPLDELERELRGAARRRIAGVATSTRRWRPSRGLLLGLSVLLGTGGAAYAASALIDDGAPVDYPSGRPARAASGFGVPVPGTVRLLATRSEDPVSGPPWGARSFQTTRGYGCLQLGRVVRGKLGILGEHGSFSNDRRFHELRPGVVLSKSDCVPLDATGHAHLAVHDVAFPASGTRRDCAAVTYGLPEARLRVPACGPGSLRAVDYGFAGPDATRVTPRGGRPQPVEGPDGAYLVVRATDGPTPPSVDPRLGLPMTARTDYVIGATPGAGALERVDYADGSTCVVRPAVQRPGGCPEHGPVARTQRLPSSTAVRAPVSLRLVRREGRLVVVVSFRARVAAQGVASAYNLMVESPDYRRATRAGRQRCHSAFGFPVERDVRAGEFVTLSVRIPQPCSGVYRVRLQYRVASDGPRVGGGSLASPGRAVGSARARSPVR